MTRTAILIGLVFAAGAAAQVPPAAPAAPAVPAAPAAPAAPVAPPLPSDPRDAVVQVCMAEAKSRATAQGAVDVTLREVKDTDVKSDGYASMRASVNLVTKDSKGKMKSKKKSFGCTTRNNVVTLFDYEG